MSAEPTVKSIKTDQIITLTNDILASLPNPKDSDELSKTKEEGLKKLKEEFQKLLGPKLGPKDEAERKNTNENIDKYFKEIQDLPETKMGESKEYPQGFNERVYRELLPYCKIAVFLENNGSPEDHAQRLTMTFGNKETALKYLKNFAKQNSLSQHPFHDACTACRIPSGKWSVELWQTLAKRFLLQEDQFTIVSKKFFDAFFNAPSIEKIVENIKKVEEEALKILEEGKADQEEHFKKYEELIKTKKTEEEQKFARKSLAVANQIHIQRKELQVLESDHKKLTEQIEKLKSQAQPKEAKESTTEQKEIKDKIEKINTEIKKLEEEIRSKTPFDKKTRENKIVDLDKTKILRNKAEGKDKEKIIEYEDKISKLTASLKNDEFNLSNEGREEKRQKDEALNKLKGERKALQEKFKSMQSKKPARSESPPTVTTTSLSSTLDVKEIKDVKDIKDIKETKPLSEIEKLNSDLQRLNAKIDYLKVKQAYSLTPNISLAKLYDLTALVSYERAEENPEAARIFRDYKMSEASFNTYLGLKPVDDNTQVPDIIIVDPNYPGVYLKKLSPFDPNAGVLGQITDCCQYIGGAGRACAIHGITSPYGGFYVLCQGNPKSPSIDDKIISQAWFWRSYGNGVLDSVEIQPVYKTPQGYAMVNRFFETLGLELVRNHKIDQVSVGTGSATPQDLGLIFMPANVAPMDYSGYRDSHTQRIVANHDHLGLTLLKLGRKKEAAEFTLEYLSHSYMSPAFIQCLALAIEYDDIELLKTILNKLNIEEESESKVKLIMSDLDILGFIKRHKSQTALELIIEEFFKIQDPKIWFWGSTYLSRPFSDIDKNSNRIFSAISELGNKTLLEMMINRFSKIQDEKTKLEFLTDANLLNAVAAMGSKRSLELIVSEILKIQDQQKIMETSVEILRIISKLKSKSSFDSILNRILEISDEKLRTEAINYGYPSYLLSTAFFLGDLSTFKKLLDMSGPKAFSSTEAILMIQEIIYNKYDDPGIWDCVKYLIERNLFNCNTFFGEDGSAFSKSAPINILYYACSLPPSKELLEFIKYLVETKKMDPDQVQGPNNALEKAGFAKNFPAFEYLLKNSKLKMEDKNKIMAEMFTNFTYLLDLEALKHLKRMGIKTNAEDQLRGIKHIMHTPLGSEESKLNVIKFLIESNDDLKTSSRLLNDALQSAIKDKQPQIATYLEKTIKELKEQDEKNQREQKREDVKELKGAGKPILHQKELKEGDRQPPEEPKERPRGTNFIS